MHIFKNVYLWRNNNEQKINSRKFISDKTPLHNSNPKHVHSWILTKNELKMNSRRLISEKYPSFMNIDKQAENGLQSQSGCHGLSSWMTVMFDFHEWLSWMTVMDNFHGWLSWMTFIMDDFHGWHSWMTFMDDWTLLLLDYND